MQVWSFIRVSLSLIFHITAISIVFFVFLQIAQWYFYHRPILGVDFFNTATYSRFLSDNFHFLPYGFKYFWYGGSPIAEDIVLTWFMPFAVFGKIFPLIESVKIASLFFFSLMILFMYLACYRLSKNQFVSALITVLVVYSANMYGALVWGGSLPYFANQLLFPAVLWLIVSYLQTGNRRWYWATILAVGLSFLGHLANAGAFIFIGSVLLLLFGMRMKPVRFIHRLGDVGVLIVIVHIFANRITDRVFGLLLQTLTGSIPGLGGSAAKISIGTSGVEVTGDTSIIAFERSRFLTLFSDTHSFIFVLFVFAVVLFLISFIFDKKKKSALGVIVWVLLAGYSVLHVFLNAYGITFLSQAWYRAFWHFPVTLGLAAAALIGYSNMAFTSFSKISGRVVYLIITFVCVIVLGGLLFSGSVDKTIQLLETRSSPSSAHPEAINLVRNQQELDALKPKLVPSWLNPNDRMYRLFTSDAQANVWWNAIFDMPLVGGYIDPPVGSGVQGNNFLLDQSVAGDGIVTNFKYPEDVSKNMALYYIDWYAVKYLEGGRLSKSPNKGPSSYLKDVIDKSQDVEVKGAYILYETKSGKPEVWEDVPQYLKYYQFRDELVSPILSMSSSPSILCFCDWPAYESVTKILAMNNINSQALVTVFSPENIDTFSTEDLSHFNAVLLIDYNYGSKNSAFSKLFTYVEKGGKVFIDTGSEAAESTSSNLPKIFPFQSARRGPLGKEWEIETVEDVVFDSIDFGLFSRPIYNESEWKFSYPASDIDSSSQVLLRNHGKPLLIRKQIGKGEVLWSGMNLAYHVHTYINVSESKFFINILQSFVPLTLHAVGYGKPEFIDDRHVRFAADQAGRGVLFKEQFYRGWKVNLNGKEEKAYKAGPTFPGFIYVPLDEKKSKITADFTYWGDFGYHFKPRIVTIVIGIFLLDLIIFNGNIFARRLNKLTIKLRQRLGGWWQREEE